MVISAGRLLVLLQYNREPDPVQRDERQVQDGIQENTLLHADQPHHHERRSQQHER